MCLWWCAWWCMGVQYKTVGYYECQLRFIYSILYIDPSMKTLVEIRKYRSIAWVKMYRPICMHLFVCAYLYAPIFMRLFVWTYLYAPICMHLLNAFRWHCPEQCTTTAQSEIPILQISQPPPNAWNPLDDSVEGCRAFLLGLNSWPNSLYEANASHLMPNLSELWPQFNQTLVLGLLLFLPVISDRAMSLAGLEPLVSQIRKPT